MSIIDLTQETNGGGSGGDIHNLGWYSTPEALKEAHPTASNGDFAIVGTTDSVWVWDSDTSNWLDTKSSGLVESVNGKTGKVVLKTSDLENDSGYITKDIDNLTNYLTSTEVNTLLDGKININEKGAANGVATLEADGKIPLNQLKVIDDTTATETTTYSSNKVDELLNTKADDTAVVHITGNESIAGVKTFTDNAKIGAIEKTANLDIVGNLNIQGNIVQNGQAYETHAEKVYTTNDYIILRDGAKAGLAIGEYSGLEYIKYDGTNNGRLVIDNTGTARVGDIDDEQPLLTRDEKANLSNGTVLIWDDATNKAIKASEKGSNTLPVYVNTEGNLEPIESYEGNSATSTKAEQDSEGQQITSTYIKEIAITGTDLTYTKGDGTAATIATQDTQVESVISATNANYPILLNNGTGATTSKANIDIEMYANPSTNTIGASTFKVGNKVNISINTYTNALDFNWV